MKFNFKSGDVCNLITNDETIGRCIVLNNPDNELLAEQSGRPTDNAALFITYWFKDKQIIKHTDPDYLKVLK